MLRMHHSALALASESECPSLHPPPNSLAHHHNPTTPHPHNPSPPTTPTPGPSPGGDDAAHRREHRRDAGQRGQRQGAADALPQHHLIQSDADGEGVPGADGVPGSVCAVCGVEGWRVVVGACLYSCDHLHLCALLSKMCAALQVLSRLPR